MVAESADVVTLSQHRPCPLAGTRLCRGERGQEQEKKKKKKSSFCVFGSELRTKGSLCPELTVTNKEEPVDRGEERGIMAAPRGDGKHLAACPDGR